MSAPTPGGDAAAAAAPSPVAKAGSPLSLDFRQPLLMAAAGGALVSVGFWLFDSAQFYYSYLTAWLFFATLTLGMLWFCLLHHLTDSGWGVVVRRQAEHFLAAGPYLAALSLPVLVGLFSGKLYLWNAPADVQKEAQVLDLVAAKSAYLNIPFFLIRFAGYLGVWFLLTRMCRGMSLEQDKSGDPSLSLFMRQYSTVGMVAFALSFTFFSFDFIMSLSPAWYSTIFGVYVFAGSAVAAFSTLAVVTLLLKQAGPLKDSFPLDRQHDLGKFMFGMSIFWAYIGYSQYFLIWYANIPEETEFFKVRQTAEWNAMSWGLPFVRFVIPFLVLLPAFNKRNPTMLLGMGVFMALMHYYDLYWLVMPTEQSHRHGILGVGLLADVAAFVAVGATAAMAVIESYNSYPVLPLKDPRLPEATADGHHGHDSHDEHPAKAAH
jgi:hypothetical protein